MYAGRVILTAYSILGLASILSEPIVGARSLALSPDGNRIAFSYRGDLWLASTQGGQAVPLTGNVEMEDNPVWSPDGKSIAFSSNRTGNDDIFVVSTEGGSPRRLTWHSGADVPSDWSPDGKKILFRATRDRSQNGIFELDVQTGDFRAVFYDHMTIGNPKYSPDGRQILYTRFGFPWFRARYQGSAASQLWIYDTATAKRTKVRDNQFQHLWPNWTSSGIMAVTMTEAVPNSSRLNQPIPRVVFTAGKTPNVYAIETNGRARAATSFTETGTRFLTAEGSSFAFERDGALMFSRGGAPASEIVLTANVDEKMATEERLILTNEAASADLSLDGSTVVFSVRGELWTVPVKKGKGPNRDDATQLTTWEGTDEQPLFTPDGKAVFFVSDREGAERLFRMNLADQSVQAITTEDADVTALRLTPDRTQVSFWLTGKNGGLYTAPVGGGSARKVFGRPSSNASDYDWSPDGKWVAYSESLPNSGHYYWEFGRNIFVVNVATGERHNVTQLNAVHDVPRWSADGKYLYFASPRSGGGIFAIPLQREDRDDAELQLEYKKPTDPVKVDIDFDEIETRARRLVQTPPISNFIVDAETGNLFFGAEGDLWRVSYSGDGSVRVTQGGGISQFDFTLDGKNIIYVKSGTINLLEVRKQNSPQTNIAFRADWTRDLLKERKAAFNEMYRVYNRTFYDPGFHGRDWAAIMKRYEKFLPSIGHRNEMATVLNMAVGELEASHAEVGAAPGGVSSQSSAHLGFSIDFTHTGEGIKIDEVPEGLPGSYSATRIRPGEVVTHVNGKAVRANEALYRDVLNEQSGREIRLTVRNAAGTTRDVTYRAMSSGRFSSAVFGNLLKARREYVESKSGGKLTYTHIAGMSGGELERFNQQVWQYTQGKKGLIIDVRNNGGGNTSDRIIDILERRLNAYYVPRDEETIGGPGQVLQMPMVVMCAQTSFSNAEMFPNSMRERGLAKLVGMPTPGYVIYTSGNRLVDGTRIRIPGTGVFRLDGSNMENQGVLPDFMLEVSPEDFFAGRDPQLDKAIEVLLSQIK